MLYFIITEDGGAVCSEDTQNNVTKSIVPNLSGSKEDQVHSDGQTKVRTPVLEWIMALEFSAVC